MGASFLEIFMQVIRDLPSTQQISDPVIRQLVRQRIDDLGGDKFNAAELGFFLVVEPGDSLGSINAQIGFNIQANRCTGIRFGAPGFTPSFEFVEEIGNCFDMVFVISDDGFGIEVFIPKTDGVDPDLLVMCASFALPARTL